MRKIICIATMLILLVASVNAEDDQSVWYKSYQLITYSQLRALINEDKVAEARVLDDGWWVTIKTKEGEYFDTRVTPQTPIADHLYAAGVPVRIEHRKEEDKMPFWLEILINMSPLLVFLIFFTFLMLWMNRSGKRQANQYDDYLLNAQKVNDELLEKTKKLNDDFLDRLEVILDNRKGTNG